MSEKHSSLQQQFFAESGQILDQIESLLDDGRAGDAAANDRIHCMAHGLHGAALTMGYGALARVARALERCLAQAGALTKAPTCVNVLDALAWLRQSLAALARGQAALVEEDARAEHLCARLEDEQSAPQPAAERKLRLQFLVGRMLMGAEVLLEQAWQILRERSTLCTVHEPQLKPAGTLWQADLLTTASDAQLRTALSHIADPGSLRITPLAAGASVAPVALVAADAVPVPVPGDACLQVFRLGANWFALPAASVCGVLVAAKEALWALPTQGDAALVEWQGILLPVFDPQPADVSAHAEDWLLLVLAAQGMEASEALRIDELGALLEGESGQRLPLVSADSEAEKFEAALQLDDGRRVWLPKAGWWREQAALRAPLAPRSASGEVEQMLRHLARALRAQAALSGGVARLALHVEALQADLALACRQSGEAAALAACARARQGMQGLGEQLSTLTEGATGFERNMQKWQQALQKIAHWQAIMTDSDLFTIDSVAESARIKAGAGGKPASVKTQGRRLLRQTLEKEWGALDQ